MADLKKLRADQRARVMDEIHGKLAHEPLGVTKHIKQLRKLVPPFEAVPPIWQLRVGNFRVFYDVDEDREQVAVRAVRRKPPHKATEEIL